MTDKQLSAEDDRGWPDRDYWCTCAECQCRFTGHKRQKVCRVCSELNASSHPQPECGGVDDLDAIAWRVSHPVHGWKSYDQKPDWADGDYSLHVQPLCRLSDAPPRRSALVRGRRAAPSDLESLMSNELWAVHAQGPDDIYPAYDRADAERHAAELNALPTPPGISVAAVVIPSPFAELEHWKGVAELEREHKLHLMPLVAPTDANLSAMRKAGLSIDGNNAYKRDLLDCVVGALAFGKQRQAPPPAGHWLERFYQIGQAEADERDQLRAPLTAQPQASDEFPFAGFDPKFCPGSNPDNPQTEEDEPQASAAQSAPAGERETIRAVFLRNGFTVKEGQTDLKPYVYAAAEELLSIARAAWQRTQSAGVPEGKLLVSAEPLRRVLNALVNAPHQIRELQATREPVALFAGNPINILIAEYNAAHGGDE